MTAEERFWRYVDCGMDCWLWLAYKDPNGYGKFKYQGTYKLAHRVSYIIHYGEIPEGMCVLHKCDNPSCVNPLHLFLGTMQDNVNDMIDKGRCCSGEKHPNSKRTQQQIDNIRLIYSNGGISQKSLGDMFGVSSRSISNIVNNKTWIK